jgi:peptidoglycan hydrolase CwlO-like protein
MAASLVTGVPTGVFAAITGESASVAVGAGTAVIMFLWSIRNTSNDQYVKSLHSRIQESQDEIKEIQGANLKRVEEIQSTLTDVQMKVKRHEFVLDQIQKKLAVHSCPVPKDANAACRLPEIISSTLSL